MMSPGGKRNIAQILSNSQLSDHIPIEEYSEGSYAEAKKLRLQIEKDVMLLRNRVRMLQTEEQKAIKKIHETRRKTQQIMQLKSYNDQAFHQKMQEKKL